MKRVNHNNSTEMDGSNINNADLCQNLVTYKTASAAMVCVAMISTTPGLQHTIINLFADGYGRCQQRAVSLKDKEKGEIGFMSKICHKYQNCMQLTLNKLYLPLSLGGVRIRMWLMVKGVVGVIYRLSRLWRMY